MLFLVKESYGASPAAVGAFTAIWSIAYFAGCILLRPVSRLLSARASMAAMLLSSAGLFGLHLLLPSLASAFLAYGAYGFLTALFWPRLMGWLSSGLEGAALSRAVGAFNLAWSGGSVIAPGIAGYLAEGGLRLPVYAAIVIFAGAALFALGAHRDLPAPVSTPDTAGHGAARDLSTALRWPAWVGIVLLYALVAVFFNIFPLFARDELGLQESRIGLILLVRALASALGFWLFGSYGFWHWKRRWIIIAVGAAIALDLGFILLRDPLGITLALGLAGLALSLAYSASIFYGASGSLDRDRRMTIHEALLTAGQIVGSVAGGLIYQTWSWSGIFVALAPFLLAGLALQTLLLLRASGRGRP